MKNKKPVYLIVVGLVVILVSESIVFVRHEKQLRQRTQIEEQQRVKEQGENAIIQDLISKHKDFTVYAGYQTQAVHTVEAKYDHEKDGFDIYDVYAFIDNNLAKLLNKAGYLTPYSGGLGYGWQPTDKFYSRINAGIREWHGQETLSWSGVGSQNIACSIQAVESFGIYVSPSNPVICQEMNTLTFDAGFRWFVSVDAKTPFSGGLKVDFSWRWIPMEIGTANGLNGGPQRGVAYFTRTANGLVIDKIKME
jgi:hypothetical protein